MKLCLDWVTFFAPLCAVSAGIRGKKGDGLAGSVSRILGFSLDCSQGRVPGDCTPGAFVAVSSRCDFALFGVKSRCCI